MKFIQTAVVQLSNGTNISIESTGSELILNKGLKIPLREVGDFCDVLRRYVPKTFGRRRGHKAASPVPGTTHLQWHGGKEDYGKFQEGSIIYRVGQACSNLALKGISRDDLQKQLCETLKLKRQVVVSAVSALIHQENMLQEVKS